MRVIGHVLKKEIFSYFVSPVVYVVISIFMLLTGLIYFIFLVDYLSRQNVTYLNLSIDFISPFFYFINIFILIFLIPVLTMRTFAEEKSRGTMELLLTYPVRDTEILLGKFAATLFVFFLMLLYTGVFLIYLFLGSSPETGMLVSVYLGTFLVGSVFISVGLLASSMTENQIIAVILAFGINLSLLFIRWIGPVNADWLSSLTRYISVSEHLEPMLDGIINSTDIIYFISMIFFFLFLTNRVLLSKKWRS
ncbi:ABC transporter permease [bacterium]|nr:ABC transporter permease [candidate division CSSED10-310 bacterium]